VTAVVKRSSDVQKGPGFFDEEVDPGAMSQADVPLPRSERRLVVEADGGSRGNPGPAAYGALVWDAETGDVLMSEGLAIGVATNNVAEYSGLIAGLEMAREIDPGAVVEVRMDSKLVVEQMAGRWKIKHPAMKPLAVRAQRLRPAEVTWTWVPRELNKRADALVNSALDGVPVPRPGSATGSG
jgi:ribonuclease H / adenosylcobalamin/alpha-ribazole phosphatase